MNVGEMFPHHTAGAGAEHSIQTVIDQKLGTYALRSTA